MVKIGLLGTGFIASRYIEVLDEIVDNKIEMVFSRNGTIAKKFAKERGIQKWTNNMIDVFNDKSINLIIVGLPNYIHKDAVIMAAKAGKNIICTKPLGLNSKEAKAMLDAVNKAGVLHGYMENHLFSPINIRVKEIIDSGGIGDVFKINIKIAMPNTHIKWATPEYTGGGVLIDLGSHVIADFIYFYGKKIKPIEVFAWGATLDDEVKSNNINELNSVLLLKYENGKIGIAEVSSTTRGDLNIIGEFCGVDGTLITDITKSSGLKAFSTKSLGYVIEKAEIDTGWTTPSISKKEESRVFGFQEGLKYFIECINKGEMPSVNFEEGYIVNVIIDAAYRSFEKGKWIKLEL